MILQALYIIGSWCSEHFNADAPIHMYITPTQVLLLGSNLYEARPSYRGTDASK
jgi:hypothetical protein